MRFSLEDLGKSEALPELNLINRGIEKESLRVNAKGEISKLPHPSKLGSALTNPYITTDFSESLIELITPTFNSAKDCLDFLEELHVFVYNNIDNELLWPCSMPCPIASDEEIPIGNYGTSNQGMMKTIYRRGLAKRYGSLMQAIAGIHYNFSFSDNFLEILATKSDKDIQSYKNETYLGMARNFKRFGWIYLLLFGSSPAVCNSFVSGKEHDLEDLPTGGLYKPSATSLRMGDLGYISKAQDDLNISYNSIEEYCSDLKNALIKPYEPYQKIGEFSQEQRVQLNTSVIQIENEYYSTIRPKRVCPSGERPINILTSKGIDYLELRCVDLNPYSSVGITEEQINFLDTLLIYCFVTESPEINTEESLRIQRNHEKIVNAGRDDKAMLETEGEKILIKEEANRILSELEEVAEFMDKEVHQDRGLSWLPSISNQKNNLTKNEVLSARILEDLKENDLSFRDLGNKLSKEHHESMTNKSSKLDELFSNASKKSIEDTKKIESSNQKEFENYLKQFLDKIS